MDDVHICKHIKIDEEELSFCKICGCIISDTDCITSIKPKKYNFRPDVDLFEVFNEMKSSFFALKAPSSRYISFRPEVINFTKHVSKFLKLTTKTYYLSVALIDQVFLNGNNLRHHLAAVSCILLAAKFSELNIALTDMCDFEIKGKSLSFSEESIKEYEVICLKLTNYNIIVSTAYDYVKFFLTIGVINTRDFIKKKSENTAHEEANYSQCFNHGGLTGTSKGKSILAPNFYTGSFVDKICIVSYSILDVFTEDNRFLDFSQLHIACACITVARELARLGEKWSNIYEIYFQINFEEFEEAYECVKMSYYKNKSLLLEPIDKSNTTKLLPAIPSESLSKPVSTSTSPNKRVSPVSILKKISDSSVNPNLSSTRSLANVLNSSGSSSNLLKLKSTGTISAQTPISTEVTHSELLNAPRHDDKKTSIKATEKGILDLKNHTTINLPNYKDLTNLSLKTLEEQIKNKKIKSSSIFDGKANFLQRGSLLKLTTLPEIKDEEPNANHSTKNTSNNDQENIQIANVANETQKPQSNSNSGTKQRRNSISAIRKEDFEVLRLDLLLSSDKEPLNKRRFSSIEKVQSKLENLFKNNGTLTNEANILSAANTTRQAKTTISITAANLSAAVEQTASIYPVNDYKSIIMKPKQQISITNNNSNTSTTLSNNPSTAQKPSNQNIIKKPVAKKEAFSYAFNEKKEDKSTKASTLFKKPK